MPRRLRIALPNVPMHIIQRGNNRSCCFYAAKDYDLYLRTLAELAGRFACHIHAYVLMTNHVHLLLTPESREASSLLMKHLGQRYSQYLNRIYGRTGTLWEGRFRSCLIQEDSYLLRCYRYIELNPVRASMVNHPREYVWSSYGCNAEGAPSSIVSPHACYRQLGETDDARRAAYRAFFLTALDPCALDEIRRATNGNFALGSERFRRETENALGRRASLGKAGRPRAKAAHANPC
ncbi:MAG: transposase [Betaproteobacteria bacterium]|nr:MAG: transposase [Betaproteobacteria bacterium]